MSSVQLQPPEYIAYAKKKNELQDIIMKKQQLMTQINENEMVKKELELLEDDDIVYKLEDGELQEEDCLESEMCVDQRLEYLNGELKKTEQSETAAQAELKTLQQKLAAAQAAAMKSAVPAN